MRVRARAEESVNEGEAEGTWGERGDGEGEACKLGFRD